ncbi:MAG: XdhC family protein [Planctomycetota bacterium]|jgi:xanthine dehydrogenase accessory factor
MKAPETSGDPGALFEKGASLERAGSPFAVATIVEVSGSAPRHVGAKMLVLPDGSTFETLGGGVLEKRVTEDALAALSEGGSRLQTYSLVPEEQGGIGGACGGEAQVFIEVRGRRAQLIIVGGGHVGQALARAAAPLGFALTVIDPRPDFAAPERFPPGTRGWEADPTNPETAGRIPLRAHIAILTHSHALDREALRHMVGRDPAYIGMIGSRRKVKGILENLEGEGIPRERLARVFTPIGLDIGAETPEEIALSILAEIVHLRRKGGESPSSLRCQP